MKQLENIYAIKKELKQNLNQSERYFFGLLPFELGIKLHKAAIDWADTTIKQIKKNTTKIVVTNLRCLIIIFIYKRLNCLWLSMLFNRFYLLQNLDSLEDKKWLTLLLILNVLDVKHA